MQEQQQPEEPVEDKFGKTSDKPGGKDEAVKKSNKRGTPAAPGEVIEGAEDE